MKPGLAILLLFSLAGGAAAAGNDLVIEINVFQGFRTNAPAGEPSSSPVVVLPPDPGWSSEIEKQRQQIAETLGLDGATILGKARIAVSSGSTKMVEFPRPGAPPLAVELRPASSGDSRVSLDVRISEKRAAETNLASFSVSGEMGKTFIVGGKTSNGPVLVSLTPRDPATAGSPAGSEGETYTVGGEVKPPSLVNRVSPRYPEKLKAEKKAGLVVLQTTVDRQGSVVNPVIVRHSEPEFEAAAIEAVRQWRYTPATLRGKPVAVYLTVTISFRLD